jgi:hypothetical protein
LETRPQQYRFSHLWRQASRRHEVTMRLLDHTLPLITVRIPRLTVSIRLVFHFDHAEGARSLLLSNLASFIPVCTQAVCDRRRGLRR